jgi:hypothetical protein
MEKTLSYRIFHGFFEISFYLFILAATIIIGVEVNRWLQNDYVARYSVGSILPDDLKDTAKEKIAVKSRTGQVRNSYLTTGKWILNFEANDQSVKGFMMFKRVTQFAYVFLIFYTLRKFVLSLKSKEAFTIQNIRRLRILGLLLLLIEPLSWAVRYFSKMWMHEYFLLQTVDHSTAYGIGYKLGFALGSGDFVWNWIFAGLLVLVIAEVFKHGLHLKQENDLTV